MKLKVEYSISEYTEMRAIISNTTEVVQLEFSGFRIRGRALHLAPLNAT